VVSAPRSAADTIVSRTEIGFVEGGVATVVPTIVGSGTATVVDDSGNMTGVLTDVPSVETDDVVSAASTDGDGAATVGAGMESVISLGRRTRPMGTSIPDSSRAPLAVLCRSWISVATEPGKGVVSAHLRVLALLPPEHTEKMPFWNLVAPRRTQRQFLIVATP
jgi:hypothetical protein